MIDAIRHTGGIAFVHSIRCAGLEFSRASDDGVDQPVETKRSWAVVMLFPGSAPVAGCWGKHQSDKHGQIDRIIEQTERERGLLEVVIAFHHHHRLLSIIVHDRATLLCVLAYDGPGVQMIRSITCQVSLHVFLLKPHSTEYTETPM